MVILYFFHSFSFSPRRKFVFQPKYRAIIFNFIAVYFFSSLLRGDQSIVFCTYPYTVTVSELKVHARKARRTLRASRNVYCETGDKINFPPVLCFNRQSSSSSVFRRCLFSPCLLFCPGAFSVVSGPCVTLLPRVRSKSSCS